MSNKTQDKKLRSFSNLITKSIMDLFCNRECKLYYEDISEEYPISKNKKIYEVDAGSFPLSFDISSTGGFLRFDPFITVVLEIEYGHNHLNVSAYDKCETGSSDIGFYIKLELPSLLLKKEYGFLRDEIANSVRHELEHISQGEIDNQMAGVYGRGKDYYQFSFSSKDVSSEFAKYLLDPYEIPAYVRGYSQIVKNAKEFNESVKSILQIYLNKGLINIEEKTIIFNTWTEWCSRHINKKGFT